MTLLAARDLCSGYDGVPVVRDLTLEVGAGEIVALLGPNGAGKTTALLTLAGHLRPSSGEVWYQGRRADAGAARLAARASPCWEASILEAYRINIVCEKSPALPSRNFSVPPEQGPAS